ncbi:hypothetical protein GDO78_011941 [Eleutherodactylus coqui]|uniref:Uncharacterized protein n=1 Tax=Eleutherodactylus coqui TaxID=57060 RepID=A0A8J6F427_ELECQ|nr:hypothetical protein GDO78_011941 [Eleutherodactylus coqui]
MLLTLNHTCNIIILCHRYSTSTIPLQWFIYTHRTFQNVHLCGARFELCVGGNKTKMPAGIRKRGKERSNVIIILCNERMIKG